MNDYYCEECGWFELETGPECPCCGRQMELR